MTTTRGSFHAMCVMGLDMHLARHQLDDHTYAAVLHEQAGTDWTGEDITRWRTEGFPSTYFDLAGPHRLGISGADAVSYLLQIVPGLGHCPEGEEASCGLASQTA